MSEVLHARSLAAPDVDLLQHNVLYVVVVPAFSAAKAKEKTENLARVIVKFDLQGFCATVAYPLFSDRDPKASRKMVGIRTYDWGFLTATGGVLQYLGWIHPNESVDFIFDERSELPACIATYYELKSCGWVKGCREQRNRKLA
jgi:hypothetical protein